MLQRLLGHWFGRHPATTRTIVGEDGVTTYQVNREVGRGGSAIISEVHNARGDRFALREYLHKPTLRIGVDAELHRAGLKPEGEVLRRFRGQGLPKLIDPTEYPAHSLVVEFIDGYQLHADPLFNDGMQTRADLARFLRIMIQLLDTLQAMYEQEIIYLDLKPENITIQRGLPTSTKAVIIHDTGLMFCTEDPWFARVMRVAMRDRKVFGTPVNLSRYYLKNGFTPGGHLRVETIYSVGVMLYQALSKEVSLAHPWVNLSEYYRIVPKELQSERMPHEIVRAKQLIPMSPCGVVLDLEPAQRGALIDATMQALAPCKERHTQPRELEKQLSNILSGL